MKLTRPLAFIDTETTGTDPAMDRIVSLAVLVIQTDNSEQVYEYLFNPGRPIPSEATEIHGITDEMVKHKPPFRDFSKMIFAGLAGCDLAGFCLRDFDVPLLWEEFFRAGIAWDLTGVNIVDAGLIYRIKEERTLTAAMKFYCNASHEDAHGAKADVLATKRVLEAQRDKYGLASATVQELAAVHGDERIDLAGKIVRGPGGHPMYAFGKAKGVRVKDDPGFGQWMLRNNFSEQTKQVLRRLL